MEVWFNIYRSVNVIQPMNKIKNKNHMVILVASEKTFDKIQHSFMTKALNQVEIEGPYLNFIKVIYDKLMK
jgi:CxxC motif-containing protein